MTLLLKQEIITIPEGCQVEISNKTLKITGKKYTRILDLSHFNVTILKEEDLIKICLWNGTSREQSKVNTCASIIKNAMDGCMKGYSFLLKAASIHFPISVELEKKTVVVKNFLGEKNSRVFKLQGEDTYVEQGEEKDLFYIKGCSLEDVSQSAANITNNCRVKNYDRRVFLDGIYVVKKGLIEDE